MNKCLVISSSHYCLDDDLNKFDLPEIEILAITDDEKVINKHIQDTNIIFGEAPLLAPYVDKAHNLKWIQSSFAGVDSLTKPEMRSDYLLTNVKDMYGNAMAEYTFAYILSFKRRLLENLEWQTEHRWNRFPYPTVEGETCLLYTSPSPRDATLSRMPSSA